MDEKIITEKEIFKEWSKERILYERIKILEKAVFDGSGGIEMKTNCFGTIEYSFPTTRYMKFGDEINHLKSQIARFRNGCMWLIGILLVQLFFSVGLDIWRFLTNILN